MGFGNTIGFIQRIAWRHFIAELYQIGIDIMRSMSIGAHSNKSSYFLVAK